VERETCTAILLKSSLGYSGREKFDRQAGFELDDMLKELKEFRKKSDYDDEEIIKAQIEKVKQYVSKIHRLIKKHMQV